LVDKKQTFLVDHVSLLEGDLLCPHQLL